MAHGIDVDATVTQVEGDRVTPRGRSAGQVKLVPEEKRSLIVEAAAPSDRETQLFFNVRGRKADGSITEQGLYYRVPPDDPDGCQVVGDYIQCPGEQVQP